MALCAGRRRVDKLSLTSLLPERDEDQGSLTEPFMEEQAKTDPAGVRLYVCTAEPTPFM